MLDAAISSSWLPFMAFIRQIKPLSKCILTGGGGMVEGYSKDGGAAVVAAAGVAQSRRQQDGWQSGADP